MKTSGQIIQRVNADSHASLLHPGENARKNQIYPLETGNVMALPGYSQIKSFESYLILYTIAGEGELIYGEQNIFLQRGQAFWIDGCQSYYYGTSHRAESWNFIYFRFTGANSAYYYENFLRLNHGNSRVTLLPNNCFLSAWRSLEALYEADSEDSYTDIKASGILMDLMMVCIEATEITYGDIKVPESIDEIRRYLESNYASSITLDVLAKQFSMSKFHLQRQFTRYVGVSPNRMLLNIRMNHARRLLRTTNKPISEISYEVGITNVGYFINAFRKIEKMTPGQWRYQWYKDQK